MAAPQPLADSRHRLLASFVAALAVVGCGSSVTGQPATHIVVTDTPVVATTTPAPSSGLAALPVSVDIPSIGVHATHLQAMGLNKDGSLETPSEKSPQVMGFYKYGGRPCESGPSPISFGLLGHIDGAKQLGILARLKDLKSGATVTVGLDNGKSCTYRIDRVAQVSKRSFPTKEIWSPVASGSIRIISCGGPYVGPPDYYRDNLVGMGTLVG